MPTGNRYNLKDILDQALTQGLFEQLHRTPFGDLLKEPADDMPADGKFYVPIRVDARTTLVQGPPSRREREARPIGAHGGPARAESAQDGQKGI